MPGREARAALPVGRRVTVRKTLGESDVYLSAGIAGDLSPTHVDEDYMRRAMYGRRVAHGALLVGLMSQASTKVIQDLPGTIVSCGYKRIRFPTPCFIGDTVTVASEIAERDEASMKTWARVTSTTERGTVGRRHPHPEGGGVVASRDAGPPPSRAEGDAARPPGPAADARPPLAILQGVRVLSCTQFRLGPSGVHLLADLGADEVKIEPPGGAPGSGTGPAPTTSRTASASSTSSPTGTSGASGSTSRSPGGQAVARRLIERADSLRAPLARVRT